MHYQKGAVGGRFFVYIIIFRQILQRVIYIFNRDFNIDFCMQ